MKGESDAPSGWYGYLNACLRPRGLASSMVDLGSETIDDVFKQKAGGSFITFKFLKQVQYSTPDDGP